MIGKRKYGIDIISPAGPSPFRVAQCKLHEPGKRLTKAVILAEIEKVKQFPSCKIDHYLILTTGDRSGATQNAVVEINQKHAAEGRFTVEVHGWDWIESILDSTPGLMRHTHPHIIGAARILVLQEFASHQGLAVQMVSQFLSDVDTAQTPGVGEHDADIDEARRLLDDGSEDVARALLQRLRDRVWDRLTSRQKFRVVTYLGVSYMATDDHKRAGDLLVEGASYEPSTEKSDVNRAIGLELRGDTEAAYLAAESACRKYPTSGRAAAARIRCAPSSLTWEELSSWITADIARDTDVGIALALRAMQIGRPEEAVSWSARAAAEADHSSRAQSLVVQGRATIQAALHHAWITNREISGNDCVRLREAVELLTAAIDLLTKRFSKLAGEAYAHRSQAHDYLGDAAAAAHDADLADQLAPDNLFSLLSAGERQLVAHNWNGAVSRARRAIELHDEPAAYHLLSRALRSRGEGDDQTEAANILLRLARTEGLKHPGAAVHEAATALCALGRAQDASTLIDDVSAALGPAVYTHRAWIALVTSDFERASAEADELFPAAWKDLERDDQRRLATTLVELQRPDAALPIFATLHVPGIFDGDARRLLNCALRGGRHDIVMDVSAALREAGVRDAQLLRTELGLLKRYAPSRALAVLQALVVEDPNNREARLDLSVVALRLGQADLISNAPTDFPSSEEATPEVVRFVVEILHHTGESHRATAYAYAVLRRYFHDPEAHRAFVTSVLRSDASPSKKLRVEAYTAVRFRDESTLRERWLVFEPDDASIERNEESATGPLISRLHGHSVGDRVLIASGVTQDRVVSILEIVDNITYRFLDSLDEWQVRFPEEPGFEKVLLTRSQGPSESNDVDFEPVLRIARKRQAPLEQLDGAYRTTPMPIFMLSEAHGSEVEAWAHVVRTATLPIRCCVGSPDEWIEAAKATRGCRAVVLDIGAVLAVDWLELRDVFAAWPVDRLLTPATFQMLRARQTQLERSSVNARDHAAAAAAEHMSDLLQFLADTCEQSDVPELAALPSETRDEFLKLLGRSSTESVAAATRPGHLLWSDQVAVGLLGRKVLGVAHGWTQAVVHGRHAVGALDAARLAGIDARLLALRYETTRYDARTIVASAVAAGWDADGFPFKQNLDELVGKGAMVYERFWVLTGAIVSLCTEAATSEVRTRVIISILDRIATRPAGFAVVRALRRSIRPAFGINHLRADEADEVIVGWLAVHQRLDAE